MKKRILSILLLCCMVLTMLPTTASAAETGAMDNSPAKFDVEIDLCLNETDRKIVLLRCQENLSFREIARQCGIKEAAARKRFERARKAMIKQKGVTSYEQLFSL